VSRVDLTFFSSLTNSIGERRSCSWTALIDALSGRRPLRNGRFLPAIVEDKYHAPGISLATYAGDRRALANVERVWAVGLDLDHFDALSLDTPHLNDEVVPAWTWPDLLECFENTKTEAFVHTTFSSTAESPRVRAFLRLSRPVSSDEYRRVYTACARIVESWGLIVDRQASDPSRFWFLPSVHPDLSSEYRCAGFGGAPIDVEGALRAVPAARVERTIVAPPSSETRISNPSVEARAAKYLANCDPAVSGSGGHNHTFFVCQSIVRGFGLPESTAFRLLLSWNARCSPPWSEWDLRRKVREAATRGEMPIGRLLTESRGRA